MSADFSTERVQSYSKFLTEAQVPIPSKPLMFAFVTSNSSPTEALAEADAEISPPDTSAVPVLTSKPVASADALALAPISTPLISAFRL